MRLLPGEREATRREQAVVEKFVKREYWRLARSGDGRFAFTRASLTRHRGVR